MSKPELYNQDNEEYFSPQPDHLEPSGLARTGGFVVEAAVPQDQDAAPLVKIDSRSRHNPGDDWDGTAAFGIPRRLPGARGARRLADLQRHQNTLKRL